MRRLPTAPAVLCGLLLALGTWVAVDAEEQTPLPSAPAAKSVGVFLEATCSSCHSGDEAEGGLDLDDFDPTRMDLPTLATLRRLRDRVASGEMPPEGMPAPAPEDVRAAVANMDAVLLHAARTLPPEPGRVTVRRLSRYEYAATVRDLLGIEYTPSSTFPNDDLGYGFDNIGDVLTISPLLLEKYAAAAEQIAARTISLEDPENPETRHFEAEALESTMGGDGGRGPNFYNLFSPGDLLTPVNLPRAGVYVLRARACADQAGEDLARMSFRVGGRAAETVEVEGERGEWKTYEVRLKLQSGRETLGVGFANDYYQPDAPDPGDRDRNLIVDWFEVVGPVDAVEPSPGQLWLMGFDPGPKRPVARRATPVLKALASRAWRRPATPGEVKRLVRFVTDAVRRKDSFERGLQLALQAVLVSPNFLYRLEPGGRSGKADAAKSVGDHALAARLSYFLWSSLPDEALTKLAARRQLRKPEVLQREVRRLLADPRATALATNFAVQWLELRSLEEASPDPAHYGAFTPSLARAMRRESELFFEAILRERRDVRELIDADFTFVNETLARHYGLPNVEGEAFQRVRLPDRRRGGILSQAGVLTVTSNPTRTSPVKRGKWVLENLLDAAPPPPPPGADSLDEVAVTKSAKTLREQLAQHRAEPVCASCHVRMDSLGLALENYDPIGRWRSEHGGAPVDAAATLPGGVSLSGPEALRAHLRGDEAFLRCLAKKLFIFAIGRDPGPADELALFRLVAELPKDRPTLEDMITSIVLLDAFRLRGVEK